VATFTVLDAADAETIAAAAGLPTVDAVIPIAAGTINSNFAFVSGDQRWFVRVNEGKQPADVAWEAELVAALAAAGVPTPVPRLVDGARWLVHRGLLVSVFPWIDGAIRSAAEVSPSTPRRARRTRSGRSTRSRGRGGRASGAPASTSGPTSSAG
jgi:Ser/Thr protein kinase RdoA (MazF antagonist)